MSDLFPAKTYCKLCKFISQKLQGDKMKKFLMVIMIVALPTSIFAIGGFGLSQSKNRSLIWVFPFWQKQSYMVAWV